MIIKYVLGFLFSLTTFNAIGATFSVDCDNAMERAAQGCTIKLTGEIQSGDANRLKAVIKTSIAPYWFYLRLFLDSPGGNVKEALLLANVVRDSLLETTTYRRHANSLDKHSRCVSACFLVWVAGTQRHSYSDWSEHLGHIGLGLHRPFFGQKTYGESPSRVAEMQQIMTESVRTYLRREQVPETYIEKMVEKSSKEIYWLHEGGDGWALNGRAPWFEEMMISRCKFDPVYDREAQAKEVRLVHQGQRGAPSREWQAYLSWRGKYNACEYEIRQQAQKSFRL